MTAVPIDSTGLRDIMGEYERWLAWSATTVTATAGHLLTRDAARTRTYFPRLTLLSPVPS
jgi:hypothetical protein